MYIQLELFPTIEYSRIYPLLQKQIHDINPRELVDYFPRELKLLCQKFAMAAGGGARAIADRFAKIQERKRLRDKEREEQQQLFRRIDLLNSSASLANLDKEIIVKSGLSNLQFLCIKFKLSDVGGEKALRTRIFKAQARVQARVFGVIK
jgi:hypothetical protein